MNQLKKIALFFFVTAIILAISSACTTGPETKSTLGKNHESENKKIKEPEYY
jgi:hypothetical protein